MNTTFLPSKLAHHLYPFKISFHATALVLAILIIWANITVIILFIRVKKLHKLIANYILLSLSCSDLLSGIAILLHLTPNLYCLLYDCKESRYLLPISHISYLLSKMILLSSVGHLVLLSTDRIISIRQALRYYSIVTKRRVNIAIISVWVLSFFITLIEPLWLTGTDYKIYAQIYEILLIILFAIIPSLVLSVQYIYMFVVVHRIVRRAPNKMRCQRKTITVYLIMFVSFVFRSLLFESLERGMFLS